MVRQVLLHPAPLCEEMEDRLWLGWLLSFHILWDLLRNLTSPTFSILWNRYQWVLGRITYCGVFLLGNGSLWYFQSEWVLSHLCRSFKVSYFASEVLLLFVYLFLLFLVYNPRHQLISSFILLQCIQWAVGAFWQGKANLFVLYIVYPKAEAFLQCDICWMQ